jgi:hypothetical protein
MPKACVTKKIKGGMSPIKAVAACYPKATKAVKDALLVALPAGSGRGALALKKKATKKEIAMSKPRKLSIRRDVPEMEKRRRRSKVKSMKKDRTVQGPSVSKSSSKKKSKRKRGGKLGRDY